MSDAELWKIKTQIRAELNKIRFSPLRSPHKTPDRSPSQRRHFLDTTKHLFRNVFNPELNQTLDSHPYRQKRHYQPSSISP